MTTEKALFAHLGGRYGAHRGITDFYREHEAALKAALESGENFDTGHYGVKHEIYSGRILRNDSTLTLEASASMDDGLDVVDTIIWEAAGGNEFAGSGMDALAKLGVENPLEYMEQLLDALTDAELVFDDNTVSTSRTINVCSYDKLGSVMDELIDWCSNALQERYDEALTIVKERLPHDVPSVQ